MAFRDYLRWDGLLAVTVGATLCAFGLAAGHQGPVDAAISGLILIAGTAVYMRLRHGASVRRPTTWYTSAPLAAAAGWAPPLRASRALLILVADIVFLAAVAVGLSYLTGFWLTYVDLGVWAVFVGVVKAGPASAAIRVREASDGHVYRLARRPIRGLVSLTTREPSASHHAEAAGAPQPSATMTAIVQDRYGRPEDVLRVSELPRPVPGDGELLVRVRAAAVAGDDWHLMQGLPYVARGTTGLRRPRQRVPRADVAGRVEAVGGPSRFEVGDEVFGCGGGFAEYVVLAEETTVPRPGRISPEEAATVPVSAMTALQALRDKGEVRPGDDVLVIGASGGVGSFAVQIAKALDAQVTGVCSTANVDFVTSLGADYVVDYTQDDYADGTRRYHVIVDLVGNRPLKQLRRALRRDGRLVMVSGSGGRWLQGLDRWLWGLLLSPFVRQRLRPLIHTDRGADLAAIAALLERSAVRPVVSATYPLDDVVGAIRHFREGHARGKVVVTTPPPE